MYGEKGRVLKVLVTGATGFVGATLVSRLVESPQVDVSAAVRHHSNQWLGGVDQVIAGDLTPNTNWQLLVQDVNVLVHLAARVHVMCDTAVAPLVEFRRVNVEGTLNLARQAAVAGVQRFVYLSSIKVNGESTRLGQTFTADDIPAPQDPYSISKYEAEEGLRQLAKETGLEVVIIRSPLVYGPGVKANFLSMMRWLWRGTPLPLGAIHNKRSLVALDNLVDLIMTCLDHPAAANQTFLVSDGEDLSTTELLRRMGDALGKPARLISVPVLWLQVGARILGSRDMAQRLCGSLQVDIAKTWELLGWTPPVRVDEGLRRAADDFLHGLLRPTVRNDEVV